MEVLSQHGISEETAKMIVRKQSVEKEMKQRNDDMQESQQHKQQIEQHIQIANGMRSLFIQKEKKGMWQEDVVAALHQQPDGNFTSPKEMSKIILQITKIMPEWLKIFNIPKGTFLRMDRDRIQMLTIQERIQKHFEDNRPSE